tara:strand:- start:184 stop:1227 length:1044 start_codon:yes stop_codon:yes gene_type:complete
MKNEPQPLVSIIILNYNAGKLLVDCIQSVLQTNYENFEIIIVDNASKDRSAEMCKEKFQQVKIIENKLNLGYCEGNNVGIRAAEGEFIVILNPDTIVEKNWLQELINGYNLFGDGIYQPRFLTTDDHSILQGTGNMIQLFGFGFARNKGVPDMGQHSKPEQIGYASGTCLFTTKKIMKKLEMFDSFLFAYHDDLDLCWRAALEDIKSYYIPSSIVFHPSEGYTFKWNSFKFYLLERNRQYCLLTHYARGTYFKMLPALFMVEIGVFFYYLKKGVIQSKFKASFNILKNFNQINSRYNEIQKKRLVSDKELIKKFHDEIIIPKMMDGKNNESLGNFIKKLSQFTRKFI